ncbi:MAG TPA: hypothetical protein VK772_15365, partial [Puia sp.]|nr:hypothetical protein [Puia sp.]
MPRFDKLKKILTSKFELDLLDAALENLNDLSNKLRLNNFAYSVRELTRHFLNSISPDDNVKGCTWFKAELPDGKLTRRQRIKYAIYGGIEESTLEELGFNIEELNATISLLVGTIDSLSKFTHITPEIFNLKDTDIEQKAEEILKTLDKFVETIESYRTKLVDFLDGLIEEHMDESVASNAFINLDTLAPHYSLNYCDVSGYHISEINDQEIIVDVEGRIHVTLEYGSSSDRREGDGVDLKESFKFKTQIKYFISSEFPSDDFEVIDYDVDTSPWYEGDN